MKTKLTGFNSINIKCLNKTALENKRIIERINIKE